jgi:hypothetical protein
VVCNKDTAKVVLVTVEGSECRKEALVASVTVMKSARIGARVTRWPAQKFI